MDPLRRTATLTPEALAVRGRPGEAPPTERSWLFAELDENADRIARVLGESGVGPGVGVAMRLPPCKEAVAALHGVLRSGAVLAPLNPDWTEAEVASGLDAVGVTVRVIDNREQVAEWLQAAKRDEALPVFEIGPPAPDPAPDDLAALVLTSGSTGVPRPVGITHANLAESAAKVIDRLDLRADDRWLTSLSLAHIGGLALIHRACVVGSSLITRSRFDATDVAELINSGEITHASLVPVMLKRLLDEFGDRPVPESLRCLLVGGAPLQAQILDRALALNCPIALTYGLTETTSQVATAAPERVRTKPGTVGPPLDGIEVRIHREEGKGRGAILVRGPTIVSNLPAESIGDGSCRPSTFLDDEGWLHTGDLGYIDAEGDLWVTGRTSARILTGGVTVEPAEIEQILSRYPGVAEVAVVGSPDPEWGQRIVAIVVPADSKRPPTLPELFEFSRSRLASTKRPRELRIVESMPRTSSGKLDRTRL